MSDQRPSLGTTAIERPYHPKLDTNPLVPRVHDAPFPRHGMIKWLRSILRFWLLPLQAYLLILLVSVLSWVIITVVPIVWPDVQAGSTQTLNAISATGQILLLAPIATLLRQYPIIALILLLLLLVVWRLDSWALSDRRRERYVTQFGLESAMETDVPLRLHGDVPFEEDANEITQGITDPLEYYKFVDVVSQLIVNSAESSPLVLSMEAKWGMGKTTAMRMIQARLNNKKFGQAGNKWQCFTVYFNPWKYGEGIDVRNGLMSAVFEAIPRRAIRWHLRESRGQLLGIMFGIASLFLPSGDAANQLLQRLDHQARYRNQFEYDLRAILNHWAGIEKKRPLLVVFVDDLDRCLAPDITRTLETIKLFFDIPGCVFVLGFDPIQVANAIQETHPDAESDGSVYLKKLVQLNYRLPQPTDRALSSFIKQSIKSVGLDHFFTSDMFEILPGGYTDLIRRGTGSNPREIKRFLNAMAVSTEVIHQRLRFNTDRIGLCLLMMLQVRWPGFYEYVLQQLANKSTEIDKSLENTPGLSPDDQERLRAAALEQVLTDMYRSLGLFPDVSSAATPPDDESSHDDTGGNPTP